MCDDSQVHTLHQRSIGRGNGSHFSVCLAFIWIWSKGFSHLWHASYLICVTNTPVWFHRDFKLFQHKGKGQSKTNLRNHIYISLFVVFANKWTITIIMFHIRVSDWLNTQVTKHSILNRIETCNKQFMTPYQLTLHSKAV